MKIISVYNTAVNVLTVMRCNTIYVIVLFNSKVNSILQFYAIFGKKGEDMHELLSALEGYQRG